VISVTKCLKTFGTALLLLGVWIFIASIDQSDFDDHGLVPIIVPILNKENGLQKISYTQKNDFNLIPQKDINEKLVPLIYHKEWNEAYVQKILRDYKEHIDNVISASKFKRFKFQEMNVVDKIPRYSSIVEIFRLLLLRSIAEARVRNYDNSIYLAERAMVFSQQIKTEENYYLVSHLVGQSMQYEALLWVHHLATDYDLNPEQYSKLLHIFTYIPSYKEDLFNKVFSGEFLYTRDLMRRIVDRSFSERREDWKSSKDWWNSQLIQAGGGYEESKAEEEVFAFLQVLFPQYYIQLNSASEESAKFFLELVTLSDSPCKDTAFLANRPRHKVTWSSLVVPNIFVDSLITSESSFSTYFSRRCYIHAHTEGVKTIVALKSYELDSGSLPDKLDELIPKYLSKLPVDPFNLSYLKYSKLNKWVYSVGNNFLDGGGSADAYYIWHCGNNKACSLNPTFPISPNPVTY
jgi:hypothetical protein